MFKKRPITRKLMTVILVTSGAVLGLTCGTFLAYEMFSFRQSMVGSLSTLARTIATNSTAALAFDNAEDAKLVLSAVAADPHVAGAAVYDREGILFAAYANPGAQAPTFPVRPERDGYRFGLASLVLFEPVTIENRRLGTLYLQSDLEAMYQRFRLYGGLVLGVIVSVGLIALVLATRLQGLITKPIVALAHTATQVSEAQDYSVRAERFDDDELGQLTDAFNGMLAGVQERDDALRAQGETLRANEQRLRAQLERLDLLDRLTRAIGERLDLQSVLQVVVRSLEEQLPLDFCCVCMYDRASDELVVTRIGVKSQPLALGLALPERTRIPIDQNGLARSVRGQLVHEPDLLAAASPFPQRLAQGGLRSLVVAPLAVESTVFGVLIAARRESPGFSSAECEFLRQLSEHVALAAHQAELYTALQRAYDDLRHTQQAVMQQERLKALGQMASGIAHDINNAISPVALYTESLLETEPQLSGQARDYLSTIQRAIEDVAQTVARMREFYREREPQLALAPVNVNRLLRDVVELTRARWSGMPQQRGVVIETATELASGDPVILGLESEIREALINLIFNAVDAMPAGGTLTLRTRRAGGDATSRPPAPATVQIEVSDTGVGMDAETRRRCLEPFFTTKGERGTGLGLAMVYGTVQRHGAEIEVDTAPGRGTTFRLIFAAPAAVSEAAAPSPAHPRPARLRILIVDDDPLLLKSLGDVLERDGHIVVPANGGRAGIDAFLQAQRDGKPFGAVITDLGMPYVDGRQVAGAIKEAAPDIPLILLTGWGQRLMDDGEMPSRVDRLLAKPPKLLDLRRALSELTDPPVAHKD